MAATATPRLILVYNADGGLLNAFKDMVHKAVQPASYPCSLCALSYGTFAMEGEWRDFLDALPHDKVFHHRDDFVQSHPGMAVALPAILIAQGDAPAEVLIGAAELDSLPDLAALIALMKDRLGMATQV